MAKHIFSRIERSANFLNIVLIPFFLLFFYFVFIASDRYISEAIFAIKDNGGSANIADISFLGLSGNSGLKDERIIEEYLVSNDMLTFLDNTLAHRKYYQDGGADWFSVLGADVTREQHLSYYRNHIDVRFNEVSGLLFVEVQAFDPGYAKQVLENMLIQAETVVNEMSHQLALTQYLFVEEQLEKSRASLKLANQQLLIFQNEHQIFSPEKKGESLTAIVDAFEGELSHEKAKLRQILASQKSDSPNALATQERVSALMAQLRDEKHRLVGKDTQGLNDLMFEYTNLQLDLAFAKDAYASMLIAFEQARAEVSKKTKSLVVVSQPSLGEQAKYPETVYILVTTLLVLLMLFGIVRMTISTIREHQD